MPVFFMTAHKGKLVSSSRAEIDVPVIPALPAPTELALPIPAVPTPPLTEHVAVLSSEVKQRASVVPANPAPRCPQWAMRLVAVPLARSQPRDC